MMEWVYDGCESLFFGARPRYNVQEYPQGNGVGQLSVCANPPMVYRNFAGMIEWFLQNEVSMDIFLVQRNGSTVQLQEEVMWVKKSARNDKWPPGRRKGMENTCTIG